MGTFNRQRLTRRGRRRRARVRVDCWRAMSWILSTGLIGAAICVPMLFGPISHAFGRRETYVIGTFLLAASTAALTQTWPASPPAATDRLKLWRGIAIVCAGVAVLAMVASWLLPAV